MTEPKDGPEAADPYAYLRANQAKDDDAAPASGDAEPGGGQDVAAPASTVATPHEPAAARGSDQTGRGPERRSAASARAILAAELSSRGESAGAGEGRAALPGASEPDLLDGIDTTSMTRREVRALRARLAEEATHTATPSATQSLHQQHVENPVHPVQPGLEGSQPDAAAGASGLEESSYLGAVPWTPATIAGGAAAVGRAPTAGTDFPAQGGQPPSWGAPSVATEALLDDPQRLAAQMPATPRPPRRVAGMPAALAVFVALVVLLLAGAFVWALPRYLDRTSGGAEETPGQTPAPSAFLASLPSEVEGGVHGSDGASGVTYTLLPPGWVTAANPPADAEESVIGLFGGGAATIELTATEFASSDAASAWASERAGELGEPKDTGTVFPDDDLGTYWIFNDDGLVTILWNNADGAFQVVSEDAAGALDFYHGLSF